MRKAIVVASAVVLLNAGANTAVFADAVTDCAKIQGKALAALFVSLFKEGGRACGQGSSMNPQTVSQAAVASMAGKLYAAIGKSVDKNGPASCFVTIDNLDQPAINVDPLNLLTATRALADSFCLVP